MVLQYYNSHTENSIKYYINLFSETIKQIEIEKKNKSISCTSFIYFDVPHSGLLGDLFFLHEFHGEKSKRTKRIKEKKEKNMLDTVITYVIKLEYRGNKK